MLLVFLVNDPEGLILERLFLHLTSKHDIGRDTLLQLMHPPL